MTMIDSTPEPEIGGDPCGDLLPGDENLPLAVRATHPFITRKTLLEMQEEIYEVNVANGWFEDDRRFAEDVALLHSEASEMLEAYRRWELEDATAQAVASIQGEPAPLPKPEGVGSEAADVLIRLLDTCYRAGIDLDVEYARKTAYNKTRGYKHGGKKL